MSGVRRIRVVTHISAGDGSQQSARLEDLDAATAGSLPLLLGQRPVTIAASAADDADAPTSTGWFPQLVEAATLEAKDELAAKRTGKAPESTGWFPQLKGDAA